MNLAVRMGRAYWQANVRAFEALKSALPRDPWACLSLAAVVWVAALLATGMQEAALAVAAGSLAMQLMRLAVGR